VRPARCDADPGNRGAERAERALLTVGVEREGSKPPAPSSDPSGLIDIRMLARQMSTRDSGPEADDAIAHLGLGGVLAILALTLSLGLVSQSRKTPALVLPVVAPAPPASTTESVARAPTPHDATQPEVPPVASSAPVTVSKAPTVARATPRPAATASVRHAENVGRCCPGETEMECKMRRSIGAACAALSAGMQPVVSGVP
jgi:hypothetical protein